MDPLHSGYLDWHLLVRSLIAQVLPGLPTASAHQLLQLKMRMQQADSDADGILTEAELQSVDMQPLLIGSASTAQTDVHKSCADEQPDDSIAARPAGDPCAQSEQSEGEADTATFDSLHENDANGTSEEQLKQLLCLMLKSSDSSNAAIGIEEVMLYLCCASDGAEGLQKAFAVVTGSQSDGQVG